MCRPTAASDPKTETDAAGAADDESPKEEPTPNHLKDLHWTDFFDPQKPWVLVPNGSLNGFWDWVPLHLRVGPWNIAACCYLALVYYAVALFALDSFTVRPPAQPITVAPYAPSNQVWWINSAGALWTSFVALRVARSPMGLGTYGSFTMQSWTMIQLRFALCALAPRYPFLMTLAEALRFPMLAQATITFGVWNLLLMPAMLAHMPDNEHKEGFKKMVFGWMVTQLHVFNIALAGLSGVYGSPARELTRVDAAVALLFALQYISLYLFVLDRIGLHFYFIFSPRSPLAVIMYTLFLGLLAGCYRLWSGLIRDYGLA